MDPRETKKNQSGGKKEPAGDSAEDHTARIVDIESESMTGSEEVENSGEADEEFLQPEEMEQEEEEADSESERYLRLAAEFDNYRKRTIREMARERQRGRRDAAERLLPVYDSLAVGITHVKEEKGGARAGMVAVQSQLLSAFEQLGLRKVPAIGEKFDPELHEAIQQMPHPEHGEGIVCMEVRAGFTDDEVGLLRPAQVIVSTGPPE